MPWVIHRELHACKFRDLKVGEVFYTDDGGDAVPQWAAIKGPNHSWDWVYSNWRTQPFPATLVPGVLALIGPVDRHYMDKDVRVVLVKWRP